MKNRFIERRRFLKQAGRSLVAAAGWGALAGAGFGQKAPGKEHPSRSKIGTETTKPSLTLNVRDYGATGDGKTRDTAALQETIDRCAVLGGGEVLIPAGDYLTGALALRARITLRFEQGATLLGTGEFEDYPITQVRWEGRWIQGRMALLYAIDADHISIVGPGKIVGDPALGGRPNKQNPLRHPALIEFLRCDDLHLEGFSTSNHLMWSIHPTDCNNIVIKNLTIRSTGGNGDGIDIDSCKHVWIDGCDISTGDDCISLKSGRGAEASTLMHTTEDVRITNCTFADSIFACIGIGSETSGGIRNVRIEHCKFTGAKTYAIYIKTHVGRGAFIEDIVADDLDVAGTVGGFLRLNLTGSGLQDQFPVPGLEGIPTVRNLRFTNVRVKDCPVLVEGREIHPDKPLDGLTLANISGTCAKGIFLANVRHTVIRNITVTGFEGALLNLYDVTGIGLKGAATMEAPKVPPAVPTPEQPYHLH